jgi:UPF0755 protein
MPIFRSRWLRRLGALAVLGLASIAGYGAWYLGSPLQVAALPVEFEVPPGSGLRATVRVLEKAGIAVRPLSFELWARATGRAGDIKAGNYELTSPATPEGLLDKLTRGEVTQAEIRIVEGWTFAQLRAALDASPVLRHDSAGLSDAELLQRVGASREHPEGQFFPDTYLFARQSSDLAVLRRAYRAMQRHLDEEWQQRTDGLPYKTAYEALIMASIVEKETGAPSERPMIAAVFVNRLKRGMLLQTDPSVIYGIGAAFDGNLRKRDLETDTPYNTYTRAGLPPTPIALPGEASLQAALRPADSAALYFVARGDGSSAFSATLEEHNQAVQRYQLKQ